MRIATGSIWVYAAAGALGLGVVSCQAPPVKPRLTSDRASERIPALIAEGRAGERADFPALIAALSDQDPAVRLYASRSLRQATGETFGYRYYQEPDQRRESVQRWEQWLAARHGTAPLPDQTPEPPARAAAPAAGAASP